MESLEPRFVLATVALVSETTPSRGIVATEAIYDAAGMDWTGLDAAFDDSAWTPSTSGGPNGIGAPISPGSKYAGFASIDAAAMVGATSTSFLRIPFALPTGGTITGLALKMRFDDGFIAYLNGVEVARQNIVDPGYPAWSAIASSFAGDATVAFTTINISQHVGALRASGNVLAVRGFDRPQAGSVPLSQDFVVQAALDAVVVNVPPMAHPDSAATTTETPVAIAVLANDAGGDDPIDPATVQVTRQPKNGSVSIHPTTGEITYTPNEEFRGVDTFSYRVQDNSNPAHSVTVVHPTTAPHRTLVPTNNDLGLSWTGGNEPFNDSSWVAGVGGIGFDNDLSVSFLPYINDNIGARVYQINPGIYERIRFTAPAAQPRALRLVARVDDGFVAYINGVRVAEYLARETPVYSSTASGSTSDSTVLNPREFIIPLTGVQLRPGGNQNVLAIHLLNTTAGNTDLLMQAELIADIPPLGRWSNEATVTVSVTGPGPIAHPDAAQTTGRVPVTIAVLDNDAQGDPPDDFPLRPDTVKIHSPPANGTATVDPATGAIMYQANPGFFGDDTFEYTVRDAAPVGGDLEPAVLLARGSTWKYLDNGTNQGTAWTAADFDDSAWASGPAKLGYGTTVATEVGFGPGGNANKYITTYFRTTFDLDDPASVVGLNVVADYDDGIVVYINGTEVARGALPAGPINYRTLASVHNGGAFETVAVLGPGQLSALRAGTNVVAVEIHQTAPDSSDISMNVELAATIRNPTGRASSVGGVTVSVASTNQPPVANDDAAVTKADRPVDIAVLANDVPDGAPLDAGTLAIVSGPMHGNLNVAANGNVVYTPVAAFVGADSFTYTIRDAAGRVSNVATVAVDVVPSIALPVDDFYYVDEDDVLNVPAAFGVLQNDGDDGGVLVLAAVVESPLHGALALDPDGGFRYEPAADFFGDDQFRYRATDDNGQTAEATVTIRVTPSPDAPVAFDDEFQTAVDTPLVVRAAPLERQTLIPAGAAWKYLDDGSDQGSSWRNVQFNDASWPSGLAQFGYGDGDEVTVVRYGDDFNIRHITTYFRREVFVTTTAGFHALRLGLLHDDGASVYVNGQRVVLSNLPATANFATLAERAISGDEENEFVPFEFSPGVFLPGRNVVAVEVHQASQFSNDMSFDLFLDVELAGPRDNGVLLNDVDVDGDVLSATRTSLPRNGTVVFLPDGGFTYTPNPGFVGVDSFTYRATDGTLQSNLATVTIRVGEPTGLDQDLNADGQVDRADLALLVANFGIAAASQADGDLDGDGIVGIGDAIALRNAFTPPPTPAAAVVAKRTDRAIERVDGELRLPSASRCVRRPSDGSASIAEDVADRVFSDGADGLDTLRVVRTRRGSSAARMR